MSWRIVTDDWRLKLLALGLAVLMLGGVAFSQNPPTSKTMSIGLIYTNTTDNPVVLTKYPTSVDVTVRGLSNVIAIVGTQNISATVDISHAKAGSGQKFPVDANTTIKGLTVDPPAPIVLDIDTLTSKEVPLEVKANAAPGWSITNTLATCPGSAKPNPCSVQFTGPAGWMANLHAYVSYPSPVAGNHGDSLNQPVVLQNNSGFIDYNTCGRIISPPCSLDVSAANIHVDAVAGITSTTIALLDLPPTHGPANGYRITNVSITPATVIISGDPVQVAKVHNITLPAVDLSGRTSDATFSINIPYPDGISGNAATATIKYSISANPAVSPSPSP